MCKCSDCGRPITGHVLRKPDGSPVGECCDDIILASEPEEKRCIGCGGARLPGMNCCRRCYRVMLRALGQPCTWD